MKTVIQPKWTPKRLSPNSLLGWYKASPLNTTSSLIINPFFTSDYGWSKGTGWTIPANGTAVCDGTQGTTSTLSLSIAVLTIGQTYTISFTLNAVTGGTGVRLQFGSAGLDTLRTSPGTYTATKACAGNTTFAVSATAGCACTVSNIIMTPVSVPITLLRTTSLVNGTFATDTTWVKGTGWTIPGNNTAVCDGTQVSQSSLSQSTVMVVGDTYQLTYTVSAISGGAIDGYLGDGLPLTPRTVPGTYTEYGVATNTNGTVLSIRVNAGVSCTISNVILQPLAAQQLFDLSGNGRHLFQTTLVSQPVYLPTSGPNGLPAIHTNGSTGYMQTLNFTTPQPIMIMGVMTFISSSGTRYLVDGKVTNQMAIIRATTQNISISSVAGTNVAFSPQPTYGQFYVFEALFNGANSAAALNGGTRATGDAGSTTSTGISIGKAGTSSVFTDGYICEMIMMNRDFTDSERAQFVSYLNRTWGVF